MKKQYLPTVDFREIGICFDKNDRMLFFCVLVLYKIVGMVYGGMVTDHREAEMLNKTL